MLLDDNENLHLTLQEMKDENDEMKRMMGKYEMIGEGDKLIGRIEELEDLTMELK